MSAHLSFTVSQQAAMTPICLPKNRPRAMASGTGSSSTAGVRPASDTPALAKPNMGTIRNETQGDRPCSRMCSGDSLSSGAAGLRVIGMVRARATPARVACTPER